MFTEKETVRSLEGVLAKQREKVLYYLSFHLLPKAGDIRKLSYNKLLLSTQEFVGRKSLENTIDEVDRLKDRLAKTDQEK